MADWNTREDRRQSGGCSIRLQETPRGVCVRYLLMVPKSAMWRIGASPTAIVVRSYEDGNVTVSQENWEADT